MDEIIPHQPMSVGQLWMGTSMPYIILGYKMCVYTCMHASIHTYVHPYIHTSIHPYVHTYVRTYITLHYITLHTYRFYIHIHTLTLTKKGCARADREVWWAVRQRAEWSLERPLLASPWRWNGIHRTTGGVSGAGAGLVTSCDNSDIFGYPLVMSK